MQEGKGDFLLAAKLDTCSMFRGNESIEELAAIIFSPQGVEFLTQYNFPDLAIFRRFKRYPITELGIYIDAKKITLQNPKNTFLVGDTVAKLRYDKLKSHRLVMMHGAKAIVEASDWTVVKISTDGTCEVKVEARDNAKVLQ